LQLASDAYALGPIVLLRRKKLLLIHCVQKNVAPFSGQIVADFHNSFTHTLCEKTCINVVIKYPITHKDLRYHMSKRLDSVLDLTVDNALNASHRQSMSCSQAYRRSTYRAERTGSKSVDSEHSATISQRLSATAAAAPLPLATRPA